MVRQTENDKPTIVTNIQEEEFNKAFKKCPVVKYMSDARTVHSYYVRFSDIPASEFSAYTLFTKAWVSKDNTLNKDFKIYSTWADVKKVYKYYTTYREDTFHLMSSNSSRGAS